MRDSSSLIRLGVNARETALRIAVCSGGSAVMIVGSSGANPLGTTPCADEKNAGDRITDWMSA